MQRVVERQQEGMDHAVRPRLRVGAWLMLIAMAIALVAGGLWTSDRVLGWWGLDYEAARSRPDEDRVLVRPEFTVRVATNALGFREPRLPSAKAAGAVRVVCLGDSFTQGYGVAADESYPRRLEGLLAARDSAHRFEVVNLGVPGSNPRDYRHHLLDPGLAYQPDVVLI